MMSILIIGGGPGGYVAAIRAAQLGAKVTLVEKNKLGGTCLNVGCIPTKVLLHAAELIQMPSEAKDFGIIYENTRCDWELLQKKKNKITEQLVKGVNSLMRANDIEVVQGTASFCSPEMVQVIDQEGNTRKYTPDKVIIATGSVPVIPSIKGLDDTDEWIDSTKALSLKQVPKSMIVIGGGVIGIELASVYARFGCEVQIVEAADKILPLMETELTEMLQRRLKKDKIKIITGAMVTEVKKVENGMAVTILDKGEETILTAEKVLVAVGRRSYTDMLHLDEAGIEHDRYKIRINSYMETNVPGIYAIGDCTGSTMLAHVASAQGEIAAENAVGVEMKYDERVCPSCVYTTPEFACVGLTEEQAKEKGLSYVVGRFPLKANGKALIMNRGEGMVKCIVDEETGKILGVHILGSRATDLIAEAAVAMGMNATVEDFISIIHAHPTISEGVRESVLSSVKEAIHIPNK